MRVLDLYRYLKNEWKDEEDLKPFEFGVASPTLNLFLEITILNNSIKNNNNIIITTL